MTDSLASFRTSVAIAVCSVGLLLGGCTGSTLTGPDVDAEPSVQAPAVSNDDGGSTRPNFEHNLFPSKE